MLLTTVQKIGPVLDVFTQEHPEWRMFAIARQLNMPKSSAHALLKTLVDIGLLSEGAGGYYRLGSRLLSLSERMRANLGFDGNALPAMKALAAELNETVMLAMLDRNKVVYIERVEGLHHAVRVAGVNVGATAPTHCTAVGKVLLADLEPGRTEELLTSAGMKAMTTATITDADALMDELSLVRSRGFAYDLGETLPEIRCIAAPIRDHRGTVIAAITVSTPSYRFEQAKGNLLERLLPTAEAISLQLSAEQRHRGRSEPSSADTSGDSLAGPRLAVGSSVAAT